MRPSQIQAQLNTLEARLGDPSKRSPLWIAWRQVRQQLEDALSELVKGAGRSAPSVLASWGVVAQAPMWIEWGSASAVRGYLPRQLMRRLRDQATEPGAPIWRARLRLQVEDEARLEAAMAGFATRGRWQIKPWPLVIAHPSTLRWWAWMPEHHALVTLRVRGTRAVVDVVAQRSGAAPSPAVLAQIETDAGRTSTTSDAPLSVTLDVAGLVQLQGDLNAALGLELETQAEAQAAAEVLAVCTSGLADVLQLVRSVHLTVDMVPAALNSDPYLWAEARLTAEGERLWRDATRPLPLQNLEGLLAAYQLGLVKVPAPHLEGLSALKRCPGLSPALFEPLRWALLPTWINTDTLPMVATESAPEHAQIVARVVLGASDEGLDFASIHRPDPHAEPPTNPEPTVGGRATHFASRTLDHQPYWIFALGEHTIAQLDQRLGATQTHWLQATVNPADFAMALMGLGEPEARAALKTLAKLLGPVRAEGQIQPRSVIIEFGNLDQRHGAK